jgi:hypothetical protein
MMSQFKVAGGTIKGILTVGQLKKALSGLHALVLGKPVSPIQY